MTLEIVTGVLAFSFLAAGTGMLIGSWLENRKRNRTEAMILRLTHGRHTR